MPEQLRTNVTIKITESYVNVIQIKKDASHDAFSLETPLSLIASPQKRATTYQAFLPHPGDTVQCFGSVN